MTATPATPAKKKRPQVKVRPMGGRAQSNSWGEHKVQRTLSLTNTAWREGTIWSEETGLNRSELCEVLFRGRHLIDIDVIRRALMAGRL